MFSNFIMCADPRCKLSVIYAPKDKVLKRGGASHYDYYRCTNKKVHPQVNVTEAEVLVQFKPVFTNIAISEKFAEDIANALNDLEEKSQAAIRRQATEFRIKITETQLAQDRAYQRYDRLEINAEQYQRIVQRTRAELSSYERQLEQVNLAINKSVLVTAQKILELCKRAKSLLETATSEEIAEYLKMVCWNPVLDSGSIRFSLKKPFSLIMEMKENERWWAHLDLNQGPWSYEHPALTN